MDMEGTGCNCSICDAPFSIEHEGGMRGFIGIMPVKLCPFCKNGMFEWMEIEYDMITMQEAIDMGAECEQA